MTILQVTVLTLLAVLIGQLPKGRQLGMLAISTFAIFWLQPTEPFVTLTFWLPVATLAVILLSWALTSSPESRSWRVNWPAAAVLVFAVLLVDLNRYLKIELIFISGTPIIQETLPVLFSLAAAAALVIRWQKTSPLFQMFMLSGIILIFIILKTPTLINAVRGYLVNLRGADLADKTTPLTWLGFSYTSFRLLHTIRDRQTGRLPPVTLAEYFNYVIFFPSFTAGPIDRVEHFIKELRTPLPLANEDWIDAGTRLFVGLFKKFVIAGLLAVISLNDVLVTQVKSAGWMWVFLYAYSFRIYFDFSGYTDIAIGMGRLMGIRLPENFNSPYLKPNLTQFWSSWHMSLTQWFRAYYFNPVTRALRSAKRDLPVWIIILMTQVSTMVLIGLWHGVAMGFAMWGLWHGIGLFVQNRWSDFFRTRVPAWTQTQYGQLAANALDIFLTFNFVSLGWLFFNLSSPATAWLAMQKLFGIT
jgi:alginate O-acetyltransferase complex protein AlgI